jgi:hypothetical protein
MEMSRLSGGKALKVVPPRNGSVVTLGCIDNYCNYMIEAFLQNQVMANRL